MPEKNNCTTHNEIQKASLVFGKLSQIHQGQSSEEKSTVCLS